MDDKLVKALNHCFSLAPEKAVEYLDSFGIKITWDWKQQLETIKQHSFTVAKAESADVLQLFLDNLKTSLKEGKTFKEFKENVTELLDNAGYSKRADGTAWRLDTIYRTNLQSSFMAGRYNEMQEVSEDYPYWQYIAVLDSRTRFAHAAMNGKTLRADDPFWKTGFAPNGYNCRCRIRALDASDVERLGLKVEKGKNIKFTPDEGLNSNPAETWQPDASKYSPEIRKQLEKVL